jgi:excisionase family DNA binding protein
MLEQPTTTAFTIHEVMARTSLGRDAIYRAIREQKLIAKKFGKRTLVVASDLERFLETLPTVGA